MVAKIIKQAGETYINTKDLKQILRDRVDFVTGGNNSESKDNSDSKISDTYKLAITSVIETLEIYESK